MIESGIRMHMTKYSHTATSSSGNFCLKLRKHLRTRRLISIRQLGTDRIVDMEFYSSQFGNYHLILEFYSAGNIILTDKSFQIIAMRRMVHLTEGQQLRLGGMTIGQRYQVEMAQQLPEITAENLKTTLETLAPNENLKKALNSFLNLGLSVSEHLISNCHFKGEKTEAVLKDSKKMNLLLSEISSFLKSKSIEGIISLNENSEYIDYHPFAFSFLNLQQSHLRFPTFNEAVDEFYFRLEQDKLQRKSLEQESMFQRKLSAIKNEQQQRIQALQNVQLEYERNADLLKINFDLVQQILTVLSTAHQSKMEWARFNFYLENERKSGNPVACSIVSVNFDKRTSIVILEDEESSKVEIDFTISIHSNIQHFYDLKRNAAEKLERTLKANQKAIKSAEQHVKQDVKSLKVVESISKLRKIYWFEKFNWFISTENYLIVGGKDAQQNELLFRKHLQKNDLYVHADIHGASSVIIKNPSGQPVPPSTLAQAGCMAICYSRAWEAKIVTSAWWVYEHQISQTAPTGQYLATGSFMIRGKKNYLPPSQLVYGFGLLFKVDADSVINHLNERKCTQEFDDTNLTELSDKYAKMNVANEQFIGEFPDTDLNSLVVSPSKESKQPKLDKKPSTNQKNKKKETKKVAEKDGQREPSKGKSKLDKKSKKNAKYQDQDEEERQIRMALLGNRPKQQTSKAVEADEVENVKEEKVEQACVQDVATSIDDPEISVEPIDNPDVLTDEENEEVKALLEEENLSLEPVTTNVDDMEGILNSLTAKPLTEDNLLFCIPVCAPYVTMKEYKYKVKLTPGTLKKGKAAKLAINSFVTNTEIEREKQLIKAIPESELIQCMIAKCKVSAPNIESVKRGQKKK